MTPKSDLHTNETVAPPKQNYYQILDVLKTASSGEIKAAYYELSKKYHPDRHHNQQSSFNAVQASEMFQRISEAYEILSDDNKRKLYDDYLFGSNNDKSINTDEVNDEVLRELLKYDRRRKAYWTRPEDYRDHQKRQEQAHYSKDFEEYYQYIKKRQEDKKKMSDSDYLKQFDSAEYSNSFDNMTDFQRFMLRQRSKISVNSKSDKTETAIICMIALSFFLYILTNARLY